jgi:hypothetical protein
MDSSGNAYPVQRGILDITLEGLMLNCSVSIELSTMWGWPSGAEPAWRCVELTSPGSIKVQYDIRPSGRFDISILSHGPSVLANVEPGIAAGDEKTYLGLVSRKVTESIKEIELMIRGAARRITDCANLAGMSEEADLAEYCLHRLDEDLILLQELRLALSRPHVAFGSEDAHDRLWLMINGAKDAVTKSVRMFEDDPREETFNAAITWITELPHVISRSLGRLVGAERNVWLRCDLAMPMASEDENGSPSCPAKSPTFAA